MSCNTTSNTFSQNFTGIKGSTLVIQGNLSAGGVPMVLTGYEFKLEVSSNESFTDATDYADITVSPSGSSYSFSLVLAKTGAYVYRVTMKDSLGNVFPSPIRNGKLIVTE